MLAVVTLIILSEKRQANDRLMSKVFPDSHFGSFYPQIFCSGLLKVRGKGPEWRIYDQSKMDFILSMALYFNLFVV